MKNKKTIMIGILCTLVCVMAVGYALLAQQLNINGRASIDSTWKVEITNITEKDIVGDASSKETPSYTSTTANFSVGLIQPGDSITYDIEVTNSGTLDAVLESINVSMDENDAITYTTSGLKKGDKLTKNGSKNTLTVKVEYNLEVTSQPANTGKELTVTLNYEQDLGQVVAYDTYSIGDVVNFAGSNWYVIKDSTSEEDYVTLMKEKILTNEELGEYAHSLEIACTADNVTNGEYGCTTEGETVTVQYRSMAYYWSDTCRMFGGGGSDTSGCSGHNDYGGSKVKEYLEGTYINTLGSDNLKEIEGYKIRLIQKSELINNLEYQDEYIVSSYSTNPSENTPNWVYQNFGRGSDDVYGYWTMTPYSDNSSDTWYVYSSNGRLMNDYVARPFFGVRPVINLLKSSI